jgi:hypothetical protein
LLFVIAGLLGLETFSHPPDRWSYMIIAPKDEDLLKQLDEAGAQGWEVISSRRASSGEGSRSTMSYEMILKRRGATAH